MTRTMLGLALAVVTMAAAASAEPALAEPAPAQPATAPPAAQSAPADVQAELAAKGRAMVEANCKRCHAIGADDKSPHDNAPPFRLVAERYPSENLAEALAEGIVAGHPDMPVFVMKPEQIEEFLAYLNSLAPAAPPKPTTPLPPAK